MSKTKRTTIVFTAIILVAVIFALSFFILMKNPPVADENLPEENTTAESNAPTEIETGEPTTAYDLSGMTLKEKVAQMIMVSCHPSIDIDAASRFGVGGICLYAHSFESKTREQVVDMINSYQSSAKVPMLVSVDEEGGTVVRISSNPNLRATPFLSPSEIFVQGGMQAITDDTNEKADLLLSLGVNVNLAPVCDVPLDSTNYIYDRCLSLDHDEVAQYASTVVTAMKQKKIGSCLKHFPGYGGSVDTHQSMSYDNREFADFVNGDFKPFEAGIRSGADCVLVSHNIVGCMDKDMPASLSKTVHDVLRNDLKFEGVIITDDLVMEGIAQFTDGDSAAVAAIKAGNDMIICNDFAGAVDAIVKAVNSGEIQQSQIDESVVRIMKWKSDLNILE